jgi:hypothetical protein
MSWEQYYGGELLLKFEVLLVDEAELLSKQRQEP